MKNLVLLLLILGVVAVLSCGRQGKTDEVAEKTASAESDTVGRSGRENDRATIQLIQRLEKQISLTDEQKSKITGIALEYNYNRLPKEERKEATKTILSRVRQEVCSPEQVESMKQSREKTSDDSGGSQKE